MLATLIRVTLISQKFLHREIREINMSRKFHVIRLFLFAFIFFIFAHSKHNVKADVTHI